MPAAAIIIPTRGRAGYLDDALASIAPHAREAGAEVIVVDDGPDEATGAAARRHGARYLEEGAGQGLNAARNRGAAATGAALLIFTDDDVIVDDAWLPSLLAADANEPDDVGALTGPIRPVIEDHYFRSCGREGGPVSGFDLGPADTDCEKAWGANLAIRRTWFETVGPFDPTIGGGDDEEEWERRLLSAGGRIRYLAAAGLDHVRRGEDARLGSLCQAARARGRVARRRDEAAGRAPGLAGELRVLAGCLWHSIRRLCMMGPVMAAHSLGRIGGALSRAPLPSDPTIAGVNDFLAPGSGEVAGRRATVMATADRALDVESVARRRRLRSGHDAMPRRRVLVLTLWRQDVPTLVDAIRTEVERSRHEVELAAAPAGPGGKFENLNALIGSRDPGAYDWVVVIDDDVDLPKGFLDDFLAAADRAGLEIAQPAHRLASHAAWPVTRRRPWSTARRTTFVEIGPVTAFGPEAATTLLPFPDLRMGWGLDAHWAAVARERGWAIGVVDAVPVGHTLRPAAGGYPREAAIAEGRAFLAGRPYLRRDEVRTLAVYR
jgi:GT2 family glycosyltransferase